MPCRSLPLYVPWKSGSPHGVRGTLYVLDCPRAVTDANAATATTAIKMRILILQLLRQRIGYQRSRSDNRHVLFPTLSEEAHRVRIDIRRVALRVRRGSRHPQLLPRFRVERAEAAIARRAHEYQSSGCRRRTGAAAAAGQLL